MATLEKLYERKRELEDKLAEGDLSAEASLARVDQAIAARKQKIQHSQKRLVAVKEAVRLGVPLEETRPKKVAGKAKKLDKTRAKRPLNQFD